MDFGKQTKNTKCGFWRQQNPDNYGTLWDKPKNVDASPTHSFHFYLWTSLVLLQRAKSPMTTENRTLSALFGWVIPSILPGEIEDRL